MEIYLAPIIVRAAPLGFDIRFYLNGSSLLVGKRSPQSSVSTTCLGPAFRAAAGRLNGLPIIRLVSAATYALQDGCSRQPTPDARLSFQTPASG